MNQDDPDPEPAYRKAYRVLQETILSSAEAVVSPESAQSFVRQSAKQIQDAKRTTPEFYVGEFFDELKTLVIATIQAESDRCRDALDAVHADAAAIGADLTARLTEARASGDREAQHAIWGERDIKQAETQGKVDAVSKRAGNLQIQLAAFQNLGSTLGVK
jgi:hypothetical protein